MLYSLKVKEINSRKTSRKQILGVSPPQSPGYLGFSFQANDNSVQSMSQPQDSSLHVSIWSVSRFDWMVSSMSAGTVFILFSSVFSAPKLIFIYLLKSRSLRGREYKSIMTCQMDSQRHIQLDFVTCDSVVKENCLILLWTLCRQVMSSR